MNEKRIHLERLLGRKVYDPSGNFAGHIEEISARGGERGGECVIEEYLIGQRALMRRLSISTLSLGIMRLFGASNSHASHRVGWDQLDLSDPERPKLRVPVESLKEI